MKPQQFVAVMTVPNVTQDMANAISGRWRERCSTPLVIVSEGMTIDWQRHPRRKPTIRRRRANP